MGSHSSDLQATLANALQTRYSLPASPAWLSGFLANARQPLPPLPALTSTAHFRILASDLTASLLKSTVGTGTSTAALLPPTIGDVATKETRLHTTANGTATPIPIPVQVLDIQDIGSSAWSQVEAIERVERGEEVRGREVIRTVAALEDSDNEVAVDPAASGPHTGGGGRPISARSNGAVSNNAQQGATSASSAAKRSQGPHKLILQDAAGTKVTAFELETLPNLWIGEDGMSIGCKMLLQPGTLVRRGMVMLTPSTVRILGGKIEPWDKKWREDRKKRLIEEVSGG